MNNKFKIFFIIILITWLFMMSYFIIAKDWVEVIKNVLILFISFIGGIICAIVRSNK